MEQFGIIEVFEEYAESKGWHFAYGFDNYYRSAASNGMDLTDGMPVFLCDFRATPTLAGSKVSEISYSCLMMLGRKFDSDGVAANLSETAIEKYDRRLKELAQLLTLMVGQVKCANELDATIGEITIQQNMFGNNIDFVVANNVTFIQ